MKVAMVLAAPAVALAVAVGGSFDAGRTTGVDGPMDLGPLVERGLRLCD